MTQERPFPKLAISRAVLVIVPFATLAAIVTWLTVRYGMSLLPMVLFGVVVVASYFYVYRRRCPECRSRLSVRRDYIGSSRRYRLMLDCPHCQIAWDTGHIIDEDQSGGD